METARSFVREVEVWTPRATDSWQRRVVDASGTRTEVVAMDASFRVRERLVSRTLATSRPEVLARGGTDEDVAIALPTFRAQRLASIVVLRCKSVAGRGGCIEVWEPNGGSELVHAEGYYGALSDFELSSRLARFGRGKGLPGIAWDRHVPHLIDDVRTSPAFLRTDLAKSNDLAVGLGVPIVARDEVTHVVAFIAAHGRPPARAIEVWVPDTAGRLWLEQSLYADGLESYARTRRGTCLMRGEGIAGRAAASGEPVVWSRFAKDTTAIEDDASRAGLSLGVAIPIMQSSGARAVLVMRT
jgi:hypothetical protein